MLFYGLKFLALLLLSANVVASEQIYEHDVNRSEAIVLSGGNELLGREAFDSFWCHDSLGYTSEREPGNSLATVSRPFKALRDILGFTCRSFDSQILNEEIYQNEGNRTFSSTVSDSVSYRSEH